MKLQKLFPLLTVVFFLSTCILLYLLYFSVPQTLPISQSAQIKITVPEQTVISPEKPQISEEEIQRLLDIENEQKELVLLFERVSADLKEATGSKQILNQLSLGRFILRDFEKRFLNNKLFRKAGGFLSFMREKTKSYLSSGKLAVNPAGIKKKDLLNFRRELTSWLLTRSNEEIEAVARFLSFFYAETLYDIPMTMLASRLTPELEEINFSTPVLLQKVLTTASRDVNGEMNEKKPTAVAEYSMAQQFFFRRGPKISAKAVVGDLPKSRYTQRSRRDRREGPGVCERPRGRHARRCQRDWVFKGDRERRLHDPSTDGHHLRVRNHGAHEWRQRNRSRIGPSGHGNCDRKGPEVRARDGVDSGWSPRGHGRLLRHDGARARHDRHVDDDRCAGRSTCVRG